MKRIVFGVVLTSLLALPGAASAATVKLTDWTVAGDFERNAPKGGGAFRAQTSGSSALGTADFLTFCLEFNEHFSLGGTYKFTLSDGAVNGGVAGGNPDPVDDATKWLYYQARTGGYLSVITGLGADRLDSGVHIQEAIWFLEQERTQLQISALSHQLALLAMTKTAEWADLYAQGHRVQAMNLTTSSGAAVQDQLAYYRVPDGGATLGLLGLAMLGLGYLRQRRS